MGFLDVNDYNEDFQMMIISVFTSVPEIYARCQNIIDPKYFDKKFTNLITYLKEYTKKNVILPTRFDVKVKTGFELIEITGITKDHHEPFLQDIEKFCRHKALELAVIEAMSYVQEHRYGAVESTIEKAMLVSLQKDLGTNYYNDPVERTNKLKESHGTINSGWNEFDNRLSGGFGLGELEIFVAPSGGGKSLALQNIALNFSANNIRGVS